MTGRPGAGSEHVAQGSAAFRVRLLGVRGSTPAPGERFARVGGHTSCLAVAPPGDDPAGRWLVLDAGTGFRGLAEVLGDRALDADVVLTHLHWDHIQGLPFLRNADRPDARIDLWIPAPEAEPGVAPEDVDAAALELLARGFAPPSFPIRPDELGGTWRFRALRPGPLDVAAPDTCATAVEVRHKGGVTVGVRVERGGRSLAYVPDHCVGRASRRDLEGVRELCAGVDVLLHDSQYVEHERAIADDFGHCTATDAVDLAVSAGAARLVLIHHAPGRDDASISDVVDEAAARIAHLGSALRLELGTEGQLLEV